MLIGWLHQIIIIISITARKNRFFFIHAQTMEITQFCADSLFVVGIGIMDDDMARASRAYHRCVVICYNNNNKLAIGAIIVGGQITLVFSQRLEAKKSQAGRRETVPHIIITHSIWCSKRGHKSAQNTLSHTDVSGIGQQQQ